MRKAGQSKKTVSATPRQLESLIRIAEARARMRYADTVLKYGVCVCVYVRVCVCVVCACVRVF